ncbi:DNA sulfur modification protein DndB [Pseudomonas graminis]|uniref:DGQHR domain-containing protein n=1 Tax=Pseudomonas graminis TaxID=158627 RepID=A0A6M8MBZ2_9PSED|nr:DNA sulfur modification protein DndB [Pseudomonas graminis]QKF49336.1 hypothetical protein FX982_00255 [Pseudomonas graminis]
MALLTEDKSALDVHLKGTIGTFRVSAEDGSSAGVEVRYLLTHVTLSERQGQAQLLDMLAPVREVFDLAQLGFDEIMQRDIDDARVSLELIPYLLDNSTAGLIKLFPPIVAVALPLQNNSRVPSEMYKTVFRESEASKEHPGHNEEKITAGMQGEEQFRFTQFSKSGSVMSSDGAELSLSRDNCALAIVDGQHRAMALLALYRNLKSGWTDARRSPYEDYYKVWPEKEIRSYDLSELQLPVLICTFPQLDGTQKQDIDVVRAARRVFLTLNKTAKRVSDSRNKLLNDQDIVAECLRETLSFVKGLGTKDDTALRIWNIELDQEGDRVKIGSDVAFSGVSHLYHAIEHILMFDPVRGIESRGKTGAPRKKLDEAYNRLDLKDELTSDQRDANSRFNYSDEIAQVFRQRWTNNYVPTINKLLGKIWPFEAFSTATIWLHEQLVDRRDTALEKMLFDGQATSRTFDDFSEGLKRRVVDAEPGWTSPGIKATLKRVEGTINGRSEMVQSMKEQRAALFLSHLSGPAKKQVISDDLVARPLKDSIDRLFDNVFSTIAFQTAVICTFVEAVHAISAPMSSSANELLDEYVSALNGLFSPRNIRDLECLIQSFEGFLDLSGGVSVVPGGATFRQVVLSGELQPSEWPKFRYLILELWTSENTAIQDFVQQDRQKSREQVVASLYQRRLRLHCEEHTVLETSLSEEVKSEIRERSITLFEDFLKSIHKKTIKLDRSTFGTAKAVSSNYPNSSDENYALDL